MCQHVAQRIQVPKIHQQRNLSDYIFEMEACLAAQKGSICGHIILYPRGKFQSKRNLPQGKRKSKLRQKVECLCNCTTGWHMLVRCIGLGIK